MTRYEQDRARHLNPYRDARTGRRKKYHCLSAVERGQFHTLRAIQNAVAWDFFEMYRQQCLAYAALRDMEQ